MSIKYVTSDYHGKTKKIAYCHDIPQRSTQSILWLSGYCSVMNSTKATAISEWATENHIEMIRFDYSGLGKSDGDFASATLSEWLYEASLIYQHIQNRPTIIVGSSMGAWLALRLAEICSPKALLLIAPAVDFTHELLLKKLPEALLNQLHQQGYIALPSQYDIPALEFHLPFIEDAEQHLVLNKTPVLQTAITMIHGKNDTDISLSLAQKAADHLLNTKLIIVEDGDHRLSRPQDLQLILNQLQLLL